MADLSRPQVRALRAAHGAAIYKIRFDDMVGRLPMGFERGQIYTYVAVKDSAPVCVIGAATGDALIERGLWVLARHHCGQDVYNSTNAAAEVLRQGNIG